MDKSILVTISKKPYRDQAIWFLNNCTQLQNNTASAEMVYKIHQECVKLDPSKSQGNGLSELQAHLVLEHVQSPITQMELRSFITKLEENDSHDRQYNSNPRQDAVVSLVELLICYFNYKLEDTWWGDDTQYQTKSYFLNDDIIKAQTVLQEAKDALQEAMEKRVLAIKNETNANMAVDIATQEQEEAERQYQVSLQEQKLANEAKQIANEALNRVKEEEDSFYSKVEELKSKALNQSLGIVQRNKAKAELAVLQTQDPLPLRKARIENEHAIKQYEKMREKAEISLKMADETQQKAWASAQKARDAKDCAMIAATEAEYAIPVAQGKLDDCKVLLEDLILKQANAFGTIFYIDRELKEAAKFLPKQKLAHMREAAEETKKQISSPQRRIS